MHKKFSGNIIKAHMLLFVICGMHCLSLHGMLSVESAENKYVLWNTIITNLPRDAYDTQRTLALVNTMHNKIIKEHHRPDKKCIEKLMLQESTLIIPGQVWWNKDFSKCAWVTIEQKCNVLDTKKLELTLVGLDRNRDIIIRNGICDGYKFPVIDDQVCPFFDKRGGILCYGIGNIVDAYGSGYHNTVIEYSLNFDGEIENKRCCFRISAETLYEYSFVRLANFPVLLKAFLSSTQVQESVGYTIAAKYYMPEGVIIPENYKTFKKHALWGDRDMHSSYDHIPKRIRDAIDKQYTE